MSSVSAIAAVVADLQSAAFRLSRLERDIKDPRVVAGLTDAVKQAEVLAAVMGSLLIEPLPVAKPAPAVEPVPEVVVELIAPIEEGSQK